MASRNKTTHRAAAAPELPAAPEGIELRDYQRKAIKAWARANGRGLLAMATGTGKTITALGAVEHCADHYPTSPGLAVIVLVPDNSLVDMWQNEFRKWGLTAVCSTPHYNNTVRLEEALRRQRVQGGTAVAVWTAQSAANPRFQAVLNDYPSPRMLIADECHALGSDKNQDLLTEQFHYRLGLSATVERHLDPEGTDVLKTYFGKVLLDIGIKQAIELGALCHYRYTPVLVSLTNTELDEYSRLSRAIGKCVGTAKGSASATLRTQQRCCFFREPGCSGTRRARSTRSADMLVSAHAREPTKLLSDLRSRGRISALTHLRQAASDT